MTTIVRTLKDVQELVKINCKGPLAWLGKRSLDAIGLREIAGSLPIIFSADTGSDVTLFNNETAVFAIENTVSTRQDWNTQHLGDFLSQDFVRRMLGMLNGRLTILPYHITPQVEALCERNMWQLLSSPMNVIGPLEDKLQFMGMLETLGLNVIPHLLIEDITSETYSSMSSKIGQKIFIVQYPNVTSGKGTFLVTDELSFIKAIPLSADKGVAVRVSTFVRGTSPNINAVSTKHGTLLAPYSYQIIGVDIAYAGFGTYCGNQWLSSDVGGVAHSIFSQTKAFGDYVYQKSNYAGIFGLDFVHNYPIEVNVRVNGGTQTLTQLLLDLGYIPPIAIHILELLGVDYYFDVSSYNDLMESLKFEHFHLCLHNNLKQSAVVTGNVPAGVYKFEDSGLSYVRSGYHIGHALNMGEFVITSGVPRQGLILVPGAPLVKIQGPGIIYDPVTGQLNQWGNKVAHAVSKAFALTPV